MAYKSLRDIIDVIRESVDVIDVMKPIYNFKASDQLCAGRKAGKRGKDVCNANHRYGDNGKEY